MQSKGIQIFQKIKFSNEYDINWFVSDRHYRRINHIESSYISIRAGLVVKTYPETKDYNEKLR